MMRLFFITLLSSLFVAATAHAALPEIGKPAPGFTATDAMGKTVNLSDYKDKIVVLEWHNPGCPFVVKHYSSNNMQKLQAAAAEKGVVWLTINSGAKDKQGYMSAEDAKTFVKETAHASAHYITDSDGKIGQLYGAKTTPHMFIIDKEQNVAYMGAIDDKASADKADIEGAKNYVSLALNSLYEGKPVEVATTTPYGCSVKYAH